MNTVTSLSANYINSSFVTSRSLGTRCHSWFDLTTSQELTDLQDAVNELTSENERLANERNVLLESLCTQTLKLENTRLHLNFVKSLLLRDAELGGMEMSDVEKQLLALIKSDQEEREELLLRQVELSNKLQAMGRDNQDAQESIEGLQVKIQSLQKEVDDASHNNIELEVRFSSSNLYLWEY